MSGRPTPPVTSPADPHASTAAEEFRPPRRPRTTLPHQHHAPAPAPDGRGISRNNWEILRAGPLLREARAAVYLALYAGGPGTTEEIATRAGLGLLTVRPRVTELVQDGLARLVGRAGRCGVYEAVPPAEYLRAVEAEARGWDGADRQGAMDLE